MIQKDKNAVIYIRVSTDEQAEKGYSLIVQRERLEKYCKDMNIKVLATFSDDYSAKTFNRPGFKDLVKFIKKNKKDVKYIFILKWDRFSRATVKGLVWVYEFLDMGIEVQALEAPIDYSRPEAILLLSIQLSVPQVDNENRSNNIKAGNRKAMSLGRWIPPAPIGYKKVKDENGKSILVPSEQAKLVREFFDKIASSNEPINQIRLSLRKLGLKISKSAAYRLLTNPVYIGKIQIKSFDSEPERIVSGLHEGIISVDLFNKVQVRLFEKKS